MAYDPTIYLGSAAHYRYGRPAYSPELETILRREMGPYRLVTFASSTQ